MTDWTLDSPEESDGIDRTPDAPSVQIINHPEGPVEVIYRASAVGGCPRKLWAARSGYPAAKTPQKMQEAYDRGHEAEPILLAKLEERGWQLRDRQGEVLFQVTEMPSGLLISVIGHWDAEARYPIPGQLANPTHEEGWSEWHPCDVKNFGPSFVSTYKSHDLNKWPHYQWQQSIYVMGHPTAKAYLMPIWDYEHEEWLQASLYPKFPDFNLHALENRLMGVELQFLQSEMPDCILEYPCPYFNTLHDAKEQSELPEAAKVFITARQNADAKIKLWQSAKDTMTEEILKVLNDDTGVFSAKWENHTISVQANSDKFNTNHAKSLLKEAGFDLDADAFQIKGVGVKLVITTK